MGTPDKSALVTQSEMLARRKAAWKSIEPDYDECAGCQWFRIVPEAYGVKDSPEIHHCDNYNQAKCFRVDDIVAKEFGV